MKNLIAAIAFASLVGAGSSSATVLFGSIVEFGGPDDLSLDPAQAVIAMDVNGDFDRTINGVLFQTGGQGGTAETVTAGGVSVTTTAANQINNWTGVQNYTGADAASATNLAEVMRDIRWNGNPNPINVDITGLVPGQSYNVQLLFNEGANRDRWWDIAVSGNLVVDNFSSEGESVWTNSNGFAYTGDFTANGAGVIDISMAANLGGDDRSLAPGADANPILQGVVVSIPEPSASALLGLGLIGLLARRRR
jgi:hypothetical protein